MSRDLILGKTARDWTLGADRLSDPVLPPVPPTANPAAEALRKIMDLPVAIQKSGKGAIVSTSWKWG
jgi:hypothetical protein